jgi:hypothetical protein
MNELIERLNTSQDMIGAMCSELRCPKMSIPANNSDEDIFISTAINDAIEAMKENQLMRVALHQASFCLRELLPNDADAVMTVEIINMALAPELK